MKRFVSLIFPTLIFCLSTQTSAQIPSRYDGWKKPSYYRGYNFTGDTRIKTLQDFLDYAKTGATFAYICSPGYRTVDAPYSLDDKYVQITDDYISYCHAAGLHYALNIREGPGRQDVWKDGLVDFSKSTIWTDPVVQRLYASMLREVVDRYKYDSLFIGISPITEPNPLFDKFYIDTASLEQLLVSNKIDLQAITQLCVDSIRSASRDIPILIQGPAYSSPEFIPLTPVIHDPYVVYEFHAYRPHEYVYAADTSTLVYPGNFISYIQLKITRFDKTYLKDTVFKYVYDRHNETDAPILLGEFGLEFPQAGGVQFLSDLATSAIENGWHFAWWNYRGPPDAWDYEIWQPEYWTAVLKSFEGNSSVQQTLISGDEITLSPNPCSSSVILGIHSERDHDMISIYNVLGAKVKQLQTRNDRVEISTEDLNAGEYLVSVDSPTGVLQKRLVVIK
ncbi:MAG: cellulase family glycosylhydrolase [Bacteroidota bacterium]|nr:cellulase family glycosylhydrolase [Bacteroidota bacterium]